MKGDDPMKVQVLGMGCPKCKKLFQATEQAIAELGIEDCVLEKVEKLTDIAAMGVMMTPALAVDGKVVCAGRVPSVADLKGLIAAAAGDKGRRSL
jgi:small redox-active disulfide protein 2